MKYASCRFQIVGGDLMSKNLLHLKCLAGSNVVLEDLLLEVVVVEGAGVMNSIAKQVKIVSFMNYFHITMFRQIIEFSFYFISASNFEQNRNTGGPPRGGRVQAGWSAPQSNFQPAFESGGNYSKQGGIQDQRTRSPYQYGGNVQSYSGPSDRGGYYRGRGGHQNYGSNEDYRRNEGTRNHYNRW